MLSLHACRQGDATQNGTTKRWFSDQNHDLFVWLDATDHITAFQFSYNKPDNEHLFSWSDRHGYSHDRIDDGEDVYLQIKMSPILVADDTVDCAQVADTFLRASELLESRLVQFIYSKIIEYRNT